jgi:hypothetical protein
VTATPPADDPRWAALQATFDPSYHELLPKPMRRGLDSAPCNRPDPNGIQCGGYHQMPAIHLTYVGHAGVTERLNQVDPAWSWEPQVRDVDPVLLRAAIETGNEFVVRDLIGNAPPRQTDGGLWINLTVLGVTRPGFGSADGKSGPNAIKEIIGDAIRNGAMRFGVGTYLWSKSEAAAAKAIREHGAEPDADSPAPARQQAPARQRPPAPRQEDQHRPLSEQEEHQAAARKIAAEAATRPSYDVLLAGYRATKNLHEVDVRSALTELQLDFVAIPDGQPVPLGAWLKACGTHAKNQGMSINDAIAADPANHPATDGSQAEETPA